MAAGQFIAQVANPTEVYSRNTERATVKSLFLAGIDPVPDGLANRRIVPNHLMEFEKIELSAILHALRVTWGRN
jgi:hypothetical protein